jgi:hypothetical protein
LILWSHKYFKGNIIFSTRPIERALDSLRGPSTNIAENLAWGQEQDIVSENLKRYLTSEEVLIHPDYSKPFVLSTDGSQVEMGAHL